MATRFRFIIALCVIAVALVGWCATGARADIITQFEESQALGDKLAGKLSKANFAAPALGKNASRRVYIYTPPGYEDNMSRTYPVLVLLHGTPGDAVEWLYRGGSHRNIDSMIKSGKVAPFIAVFPDGHGPFTKGGSEWADAVNGKSNMETAITHDLPAWLKQHYRVSANPAQWAIGGLSAGGYGAANLLVRHPDTFRTGIILSGDYEVSDDWGDATAVFGTDPKVRAANSPQQSVRHLPAEVRPKLFFYLAVGQDDDSDLITQNESFAVTCKALGIPVLLDTDRGGHQWGFWSSHLKTGILAWSKRMSGTN